MADQADVEQKLVEIIGTLIYPNGADHAPAISGSFKIYRGWPLGTDIDKDVTQNITNITVFPRVESAKNTDRYPPSWQTRDAPVHTIVAAVNAVLGTITLTGTNSADNPQFVTAIINGVDAFSYGVLSGDTIPSAALALAALIGEKYEASAANGVISIVGVSTIVARVGATGTVWKEVGRQRMDFQITIWAPSEETRTNVARLLDPHLRDMPRIILADKSVAHMCFARPGLVDNTQKTSFYRRDMVYDVEFPSSLTMVASEITALQETISSSPDAPPVIVAS